VIGAASFALIGQLDMFTSTVTGFGYLLGLVAMVAAWRRREPEAVTLVSAS
jgi:hypothetical protein